MEQLNGTPPCLMKAWKKHEHELLCWLLRQVGNEADADDLIQETFSGQYDNMGNSVPS
jgi:RNA polymerase sigma-70 factor (ECF subfamily)